MITLSCSNDNRIEFLQATCDPTACQIIVNDEAPFVSRLESLTLKLPARGIYSPSAFQ